MPSSVLISTCVRAIRPSFVWMATYRRHLEVDGSALLIARQHDVAISTVATLTWSPMSRPAAHPRRTKGVLGGRSDEVVRHVLDAAIVELARSGYAGF